MASLKSDNPVRMREAMDELAVAYANLLDIDKGDLSSEFLESTKNLNLMNEAIKGNLESYNALVDAANADYLHVKLGLDKGSADLLASEYRALLNSVDFDTLPVHAELDDQSFLDGLSQEQK